MESETVRSRERLVVYRRTVEKIGDGERWGKMEYGLRRWWRAFRGGPTWREEEGVQMAERDDV